MNPNNGSNNTNTNPTTSTQGIDTMLFAQRMLEKLSETDPMAATEKAIAMHILTRAEALVTPIVVAVVNKDAREQELHAIAMEERRERKEARTPHAKNTRTTA